MAVKVLAISASPRKDGNSDVLCEQFLKGASEVGNEVEKISLRQMNITPCIACYGCSKSHKCVKEDDMHNILQKLIGADVIVLATPVYFYSMDAQMKTMIDRCLPRYQEIRDKDFTTLLRLPNRSTQRRMKRSPDCEAIYDACPVQQKKGLSMEPEHGIEGMCTGIHLLRKPMKWAKQ